MLDLLQSEFLETQVAAPVSRLTLDNLFDSYDQRKIHSKPSVRWDLFLGGAERGIERLMMDFFWGRTGRLEVVPVDNNTGNGFAEDLIWLKEIVRRRKMKEEFLMRIGLREWVGLTDLQKDSFSTVSCPDR